MRISTLMSYAGGFKQAVDEIALLEKAGLDMVWVPEAYSFDAPSAMGYLAARTERVTIASGILPIYSRTPTLLAMTAAGIDYLSDGRCLLGRLELEVVDPEREARRILEQRPHLVCAAPMAQRGDGEHRRRTDHERDGGDGAGRELPPPGGLRLEAAPA